MQLIENSTKARMALGETAHGIFLNVPDASVAEMLALAGFDFVVLDGEHGPLSPRDVENMTRAVELHGVTPIVRATTNEPSVILRYLDAGPHGVHVPWVNDADGVARVVQSVRFGPEGNRGLAGTRGARWGAAESYGDYTRRWNAESLVIVHVETKDAVDAIDDMLAVPGVDVLFIGPTDLSHSLGFPGQKDHPSVVEAMEHVASRVVGSDVHLGLMVGSAAEARTWAERGARYITVSFPGVLRSACLSLLDDIRGG